LGSKANLTAAFHAAPDDGTEISPRRYLLDPGSFDKAVAHPQ
jgi:hypothetical protein